VVDVESAPLEQVVKQLDKLVNVVKITELSPGESGLAYPGRTRHHDSRRTGPDRGRDPAQLLVPAGERPRPLHHVRLTTMIRVPHYS